MGNTVPLAQRTGYPRPALTIPAAPPPHAGAHRFATSCRATIDHVSAPCPVYVGPMANGVCRACEARIISAMHGALARYGNFAFASELQREYDTRRYNPGTLRTEGTR